MEERTKLVVVNENTLGYILPETPETLGVLHSSILRGAVFEVHPEPKHIISLDKVRLATEKDFENYRVSFKGFDNQELYEYGN
ncbi:MAG: hypothetical protein WCK78_04275 [Paludibacter sp.]